MTQGNSLLGKFHLNEDAVCFGIFKANDDVFLCDQCQEFGFCVVCEQTHRPEAG